MDTKRFPVEQVSWNDAVEFCRKLSARDEEKRAGRVYRLPTEAEWEYACRAGTTTPFHYGDSLSFKQANVYGTYPYVIDPFGQWFQGSTTTVGSYQPNAFGLYDMHGNVWEWCQDYYDSDYYGISDRKDPQGPQSGVLRVLRGGCWDRDGLKCRASYRDRIVPDARTNTMGHMGFRVVLVVRTP